MPGKRSQLELSVASPSRLTSSFKGDARPPFKKFFGLPTWQRLSSAYGYAQALDGTWDEYLACCNPWFAKRNKFESATDFIGWYSTQARNRLGIPSDDPYNLYLAYHEGLRGYQQQSYLKKPWLMAYARKVAVKSQVFQNQLAYLENPYGFNPIAPCPVTPSAPTPNNEECLPELEPPSMLVYQSEKDSEVNL